MHHRINIQEMMENVIVSFWAIFSFYYLYQFARKKDITTTSIRLSFGLIFPFWFIVALIYLKETIFWFPQTHDFSLYAIDSSLGIHPNFLLSQLFMTFPFLIKEFFVMIYFALPLTFIFTYLMIPKNNSKDRYQLVLEFSVIGIVGMIFYCFMPSCGPVCTYGQAWPWQPPGVPLDPPTLISPLVSPSEHLFPRNSLPSLHTAWILCLWWYCQKQGTLFRMISHLWAILALYATIVIGQHYLIDVITGFAFALMVIGFCRGSFRVFIVGTCLFIGWLWMIQHGLFFLRFSPLLPIILYSVTVFTVIFLVHFKSESNLWQVIANGRTSSIAKVRKMLNVENYSPN